ncbi:MAG: hypothetical protein A2X94_07240 [Bdellovibrionales bacterium GWB1_55_8]|nr:MAG: hypothetical protein A2X94_07240 [Bdellovibrionales bacterium GWB1_55_8]
MDRVDLTSLLLSVQAASEGQQESQSESDARTQLAQILGNPRPEPKETPVSSASKALSHASPTLTSVLPALIVLKTRLISELESSLNRLLSLNPSRREAVALYLDSLARQPSGPSTASASGDTAGGLRRWIEGPRTPTQEAALRAYLEELALIVLGQTLLLKAWSDRGLRNWSRNDLGNLNWALSSALKPHVPLDRESWQVTRPNLYSWYVPAPALQEELWAQLQTHRLTDEGPGLLTTLLTPTQLRSRETGYDSRFFEAVWAATAQRGFNVDVPVSGARRRRYAFCPTLREGSVVRTGPVSLHWIGTETSNYQLMVAELAQLWWGPAAPPLWTTGNGLETHSRDQLALALNTTKPSLVSRIGEMEACDLAFVFEERIIRSQGRDLDSQRLKAQLDESPYFRKIRRPTTSLGTLQACVALTKLRPGGLLWWGRDESLSSAEGDEALGFLLERGSLLCEWDFSSVQHSLPSNLPLFPKHLYLFAREADIEVRLMNRPLRLSIHGQVRSHVELPLLLNDALKAAQANADTSAVRGHWKIHPHRSPAPQKDWVERWPDPACNSTINGLEELRMSSLPLAHATSVARAKESISSTPESEWTDIRAHYALLIQAEVEGDQRHLKVTRHTGTANGSGFLIYVPDESWIGPLGEYLQSAIVREWMEHHAERRGARWHLDEQTVRWIPVPKSLFKALGVSETVQNPAESLLSQESPSFAVPLPGEWEKLASEVAYKAREVRAALERSSASPDAQRIHASIYVRASRALEAARAGLDRLSSVIDYSGRIRWQGILDILPKSEPIAITLHPQVTLRGNLPLHIPVSRIERVKTPSPGILLSTELGLTMLLACDDPQLLEMILEQLQGHEHATWSELTQYLRVPRRMEFAHATASDILRSHGEQSGRIQELIELLSACRLF